MFLQSIVRANNMTLAIKQRGKLLKLFYLTEGNASKTLQIYRQNYQLRKSFSARGVHKLIKKN